MKPRLTVTETVYVQRPGYDAVSYESRFSRALEQDEQPYSRTMLIGNEWAALDTCWVEQPCCIHVCNDEGITPDRVLSDAEKQELHATMVIVAANGAPFAQVRPRESARFEPVHGTVYTIRSTGDKPVRCTVSAICS